MTSSLRSLLVDLPAFDAQTAGVVRARSEQVLRPGGALQRLDDVAVHVAGWHGDDMPSIDRPAILVFAGDHGVTVAGVSNYPADITATMLGAVRAERATINAYARSIGATLDVVDVGVGNPTGDIRTEPALSATRFDEIVTTAVDVVDAAVTDGADLFVLGELGIGNTTVAAALPAALLGGATDRWVGRGTGIDDDGLVRKQRAVAQAVDRVAHLDDPIEVMREIGGAELVAMAAACARARRHRVPVVLDGYIASSAVLPLHAAQSTALEHCLAGHISAEPGHRAILDHIDKTPLLDLGLRLGEGTGAAAAIPLVRLACAGVSDVATFDEWFGG